MNRTYIVSTEWHTKVVNAESRKDAIKRAREHGAEGKVVSASLMPTSRAGWNARRNREKVW